MCFSLMDVHVFSFKESNETEGVAIQDGTGTEALRRRELSGSRHRQRTDRSSQREGSPSRSSPRPLLQKG